MSFNIRLGLYSKFAADLLMNIHMRNKSCLALQPYTGPMPESCIRQDSCGEVIWHDVLSDSADRNTLEWLKKCLVTNLQLLGRDIIRVKKFKRMRKSKKLYESINANEPVKFQFCTAYPEVTVTLRQISFLVDFLQGSSPSELIETYGSQMVKDIIGSPIVNPFVGAALESLQKDLAEMKQQHVNEINLYDTEELKRRQLAYDKINKKYTIREEAIKKKIDAILMTGKIS